MISMGRACASWFLGRRCSRLRDSRGTMPMITVRGTRSSWLLNRRGSWFGHSIRAMPMISVRRACSYRLLNGRGGGFWDPRGTVPVISMSRTRTGWLLIGGSSGLRNSGRTVPMIAVGGACFGRLFSGCGDTSRTSRRSGSDLVTLRLKRVGIEVQCVGDWQKCATACIRRLRGVPENRGAREDNTRGRVFRVHVPQELPRSLEISHERDQLGNCRFRLTVDVQNQVQFAGSAMTH